MIRFTRFQKNEKNSEQQSKFLIRVENDEKPKIDKIYEYLTKFKHISDNDRNEFVNFLMDNEYDSDALEMDAQFNGNIYQNNDVIWDRLQSYFYLIHCMLYIITI